MDKFMTMLDLLCNDLNRQFNDQKSIKIASETEELLVCSVQKL